MIVNRLLFFVIFSLLLVANDSQSQVYPATGLFIMLKGVILLPGESVVISDIGPQTSDRSNTGSTLVCVTTNINTACCRRIDNNRVTNATAGAVGEWLYPNSTLVPRPGDVNVVDFARFGNTQQVRLGRVVPDSTTPLGVYTCQVPEPSTGVLHNASITIYQEGFTSFTTVAVTTSTYITKQQTLPDTQVPHITTPISPVTQTPSSPPPPVVSLTAPGPALVGSEVTLNCSSDVMGSFVWSHSSISDLSSAASVAISQDASGVFSVLTISSVLISHAGTYSCEISAAGQSSTKSSHLRVKLTPLISVEVTSPLNLLEFSLTLTCSVGVAAMLEPGIQVQVQWTDSSGRTVAGRTPGTSYTSQLTLTNTEESNVGVNYSCTASLVSTLAFIDASDSVSNSTTIPPQTAFLQMKLAEISDCVSWKSSNAEKKNTDIVNGIVSTVSSTCGCGFTSDLLTDSVFLCSSSSPNAVTYQAQLHGTAQANVSQLINIIEEEIFKGRMSIKVQFFVLLVENICILPYGTERPCDDVTSTNTEVMEDTRSSSPSIFTGIVKEDTCSSSAGIFTGIVITLVIVILVMGFALVALTLKVAQNRKKQTHSL